MVHNWMHPYGRWQAIQNSWIINFIHSLYISFSRVYDTLRPPWSGCHFPDNILECILFKEYTCVSFFISLKFVSKADFNEFMGRLCWATRNYMGATRFSLPGWPKGNLKVTNLLLCLLIFSLAVFVLYLLIFSLAVFVRESNMDIQ